MWLIELFVSNISQMEKKKTQKGVFLDNAVLCSTGNMCKLDDSVAVFKLFFPCLSVYFLTEGLHSNFIIYGLSV